MTIIPALIVNQWLSPEWDQINMDPSQQRERPEPHFYVFSMGAYDLKKLSGIYRRDASKMPAEDIGIQRRHDPKRSKEILRYIQDGFPLSRIDRKKLVDSDEVFSLKMPGWLPTAVVVNILKPEDRRGGKRSKVASTDLVKVTSNSLESTAHIELPANFQNDDWEPAIHPIEVIDGQHRLWALEEPTNETEKWPPELKEKLKTIQIPVVAFHGIDRAWQAYLFYTINQLAKKIDSSMVFDLYPLLREEEWLLRFEGPSIYRDTRAQDLTILLWAQPESPWKGRISRLGREKGKVTQASFIRSLTASFIKRWPGKAGSIGGLLGARTGTHQIELGWGREQQAALLIMVWQNIQDAVVNSRAPWALNLIEREAPIEFISTEENDTSANSQDHKTYDFLFLGNETLLATDQGVRGYLCVINDLLWVAYDKQHIDLGNWSWVRNDQSDDEEAISSALISLYTELTDSVEYIKEIATLLSDFDWRLSSAISANKDPDLHARQAAYRGSGGYSLIRRNLIVHLINKAQEPISRFAGEVAEALKFEIEEEELA